MKNIAERINENSISITEAKAPDASSIYTETIDAICNLIINAPTGRYTLNSSDIHYAVEDLLEALKSANYSINEASMNGEVAVDDIKKSTKLKNYISKNLLSALYDSANNDYDINFDY